MSIDPAIFERAAVRVSRPFAWTKGCYARTLFRKPIDPTSPKARCFCILGAIKREAHDAGLDYQPYFNEIHAQLDEVVRLNDQPGASKRKVAKALRQAARNVAQSVPHPNFSTQFARA